MVEPSDAVQIWLWIGTIGMALGALAFLFMAAREKPGNRWFHTITFFVNSFDCWRTKDGLLQDLQFPWPSLFG